MVSLRMTAGGIVYRDRVRVSSGRGDIGPVPARILPPLPRTLLAIGHVTGPAIGQDMDAVMVVHEASSIERAYYTLL